MLIFAWEFCQIMGFRDGIRAVKGNFIDQNLKASAQEYMYTYDKFVVCIEKNIKERKLK